MYQFLNLFFFFFHTALVLFNSLGWIYRSTRKWNLITLLLTAFSWFVLGIWYGWGYCPFTDWHWQVRRHLGFYDQTNSYIHFLILKISGFNLPMQAVETGTVLVFVISLFLSIALNIRDLRKQSGRTKQVEVR